MLGSAAAAVDRAATLAVYAQSARRRQRTRAEALPHEERLHALGRLRDAYVDTTDFFLPPTPLTPSLTPVRALPGGRVDDMRWSSDYQTYLGPVAERYGVGGKSPAVRLWRHQQPRPVLILVHGYLGGQHNVEERVWPSEWLFRRGVDLAFFVLPYHGVRSARGRFAAPPFPGSDPRITNEGFRQAMYELTSLTSWLLERGHPHVGVMGMSLGGYTTALASTVEPRLRCAVPVIPLSSIADFARDQGRLGTSPAERELEHAALDAVHEVVSPLHRAPLLRPEHMLIVGAEADRITPLRHAERLGEHFGAPLETWHGGHLLQFGRRDKFRRIGRFLHERGMFG